MHCLFNCLFVLYGFSSGLHGYCAFVFLPCIYFLYLPCCNRQNCENDILNMESAKALNHIGYEVIQVNGTPMLIPNDLVCENDVILSQPELQNIAYQCKDISTEQLSSLVDPDALSIVHINARSLNTNFDDIVTFIVSQKCMIDFILISETWLDPALSQGYKIQGYEMLHCAPDSYLGKGCAIYIKSNIYPFCKQIPSLLVKHKHFQSLFIEVTWPNKQSIAVGVVYRSPSYPLDISLPSIELTLNKLKDLKKASFIGGDWNVDLFHYRDRGDVQSFLDCMTSYGYVPTISIPSRVSNIPPFTRTLIDNIFCNTPGTVLNTATVSAGIADHLVIFCSCNIPKASKNTGTIPIKSGFDIRRIEELKTNVLEKLVNFRQIDDPERGADLLISTIQCEMSKLTAPKVSKRWTPVQPWITPALLRCIGQRNLLLKQFLKSRTSENESKFRKYRNMLRLTIRHSKKLYYESQFKKHSNNPRRLWSTLQEVTHTKRNASRLPFQFELNGSFTNDQHLISQEFNNYFNQVGPNLDDKLGPSDIDPITYLNGNAQLDAMTFLPVTPQCVLRTVSDLKETSAGLDGITSKVLKLIIPSIISEATHLVNLCLKKGVFPSIFKQALITPIFKTGAQTAFSNYRPISILPVFSKVLESIMYTQLTSFISENNVLYEHQFGFRPGHSTYMPAAILHDFVTGNLADRKKTACIYLDLARAFDTVNIEILLKKLYSYGITGTSHNLLKSYLSQRSHRLKYNDIVSDEKHISCGVPQGSILGPLLFTLYINDISNVCDEAKILLFADDTALLYSAPTLDLLQIKISNSFPKICTWLHANRLSLSTAKTVYQIFNEDRNTEIQIPVMNSLLKRACTVKYLGLLIDDDLKFKSHITRVTGLCSRTLGILHRSSYFLNKTLLLLLYNSLILPYISYCAPIWGLNYETNLKPLITIQKRAIRLLAGARPFSHTSPLFRDLKLLKLTDLIKYQILLIMHDCLFERLPQPLAKFNLNVSNRPARNVQHFNETIPGSSGTRLPNYRLTNYRQFVLFYRGPILWNNLIASKIPNIIDIPSSKSLFKKCIKILFLDTY